MSQRPAYPVAAATSVIVHDPRALVAAATGFVIKRHSDCALRGVSSTLEDTFALLRSPGADALVLSCPDRRPRLASSLLVTLRAAYPRMRLVFLTERRDLPYLSALLRAGVDACVSQFDDGAHIGLALARSMRSAPYLSPQVEHDLASRRRARRPREVRVDTATASEAPVAVN